MDPKVPLSMLERILHLAHRHDVSVIERQIHQELWRETMRVAQRVWYCGGQLVKFGRFVDVSAFNEDDLLRMREACLP